MSMIRFAWLCVCSLLAAGSLAQAEVPATFQKLADSMGGVWFATEVAGDKKPRVLRITNVKFSDSKSAQYVGYYGYADGSWKLRWDIFNSDVPAPGGQ